MSEFDLDNDSDVVAFTVIAHEMNPTLEDIQKSHASAQSTEGHVHLAFHVVDIEGKSYVITPALILTHEPSIHKDESMRFIKGEIGCLFTFWSHYTPLHGGGGHFSVKRKVLSAHSAPVLPHTSAA